MADSPTLAAALDYAARGWAVIPLCRGGTKEAKEPATVNGLKDASTDPDQIRYWWASDPAFNVAIVCGRASGGLLVIDVDAHGADGMAALREWETENGELPETVTAVTGTDGRHLIYRADHEMRPSANPDLGIDIRCDGSYIVAPPSIHPNGNAYEWSVSPEDVDPAPADARVLAFVDHVRPRSADKFGRRERFTLPERVGEGGRNDMLYRYGCSLQSRSLPDGDVEELMRAKNRTVCDPPLDEGELAGTIRSVLSLKKGLSEEALASMRAADTVESDAELIPDDAPVNKGKGAMRVADLAAAMMRDARIGGAVRWDVHAGAAWRVGALPYEGEGGRPCGRFDDRDRACVFAYVQKAIDPHVGRDGFDLAFQQMLASPEMRLDRLGDELGRLPRAEKVGEMSYRFPDGDGAWGEPVDSMAGALMGKYLGVDIDEYSYEVERLVLREIVARAMFPGCKADYMLVLTGPQGIGKSTFCRALALNDEFFLDDFRDFKDPDCIRNLRGKLVVEVAELDALGRSGMSAVKSVLTTQVDTTRDPYGHFAADHPRTCVFIGTTNERYFLTDTTGNRRFLPVECHGDEGRLNAAFRSGGLQADVERAYAETLAELREVGEEAFVQSLTMPHRLDEETNRRQGLSTVEDKTQVAVDNYAERMRPGERVNVRKMYLDGFKFDEAQYRAENRMKANDVANALDRCPLLARLPGRQRVEGYGAARAWERVEGGGGS